MKLKTSGLVYQLKITLLGSEPPIWRRILVARNVTLKRLHFIIQAAMGWQNSHLHLFETEAGRYGEPNPEWDDVEDHAAYRLYHVAHEPGHAFRYIYDMGDGWQHEIEVEAISADSRYHGIPVCIDGARACPPEDCGGIGGYAELLEALTDTHHERHNRMKEWLGHPFDPEAFDPATANEKLAESVPVKIRRAAALAKSKDGRGPTLH
ncbi:MAG: plasmid pRiA4b ORF-3 family protein [Elusimicrobia bacterium]|nr:plasmid pRiA4b ORF-3 family protein [Elusimicrobiota bacterium]